MLVVVVDCYFGMCLKKKVVSWLEKSGRVLESAVECNTIKIAFKLARRSKAHYCFTKSLFVHYVCFVCTIFIVLLFKIAEKFEGLV